MLLFCWWFISVIVFVIVFIFILSLLIIVLIVVIVNIWYSVNSTAQSSFTVITVYSPTIDTFIS